MNKKLTDKEFEKMVKEVGPQRVLGRWCNLKINLTPKQLTKLYKLKKQNESWEDIKVEKNKKSKAKRN